MKPVDSVEEYWDVADIDRIGDLADAHSVQRFEDAFAQFTGCGYVRTTASARWSLQWILKNQDRAAPGGKVFVAVFNCPVVLDAVLAAGCVPVFYDFALPNGRIDWTSLAEDIGRETAVAAVVIPHLFGVPSDFRPIIDTCRRRGILIIEDCAHTLGGAIDGRHVGHLGDAAIFSFNYDKPISLGWGGAIVLSAEDLIARWQERPATIPSPDQELALLRSFTAVMRRRRAEIGKSRRLHTRVLQKLGLAQVRFNMPLLAIGQVRAELGIHLLERFPTILQRRNANTLQIMDACKNIETWHVDSHVQPSWLKLKMFNSSLPSEVASSTLQSQGIRAGMFNWPKLLDPNGKRYPNATLTACEWLDIPVHQNLLPQHIRTIIDSLQCTK